VNTILARKQHGAGGSIILYQIENEHRWNDRVFLAGLSDAARADGITVPLVGNHDGGGLCALDKLAEGTDIYTPVYEFCRWRGWLETMTRRIGPELPLMVLEFRCGEHPLWGQAAVADAWPPAHWTLSQTRLFMAVGANVVNHFVGAGGITPIGFNSDHIITSYVDNPPVSPWGELTPRFYEMRLLGLFQESFNRALAESAPVPGAGWGTDNVQVECLVRRGAKATFLFLANHSNTAREFRILLPDGSRVPEAGPLQIDGFRTQILVADADLGNGVRLEFCPFQILSTWVDGNDVQLIVYGEPGTRGTLEFAAGTERHSVAIACTDTIGTATLAIAGKRVAVYAASAEIAARTWLPRAADGRTFPLFGRVSLMRPQPAAGAPIRLEVPAADTTLKLTVPAEFAGTLRVDVALAALRTPRPDSLASLTFRMPPMPLAKVEVGQPQFGAIEDGWTTTVPTSETGWRPATPWGAGAFVMTPNSKWPDRPGPAGGSEPLPPLSEPRVLQLREGAGIFDAATPRRKVAELHFPATRVMPS
jgi:hypothetical protein